MDPRSRVLTGLCACHEDNTQYDVLSAFPVLGVEGTLTQNNLVQANVLQEPMVCWAHSYEFSNDH